MMPDIISRFPILLLKYKIINVKTINSLKNGHQLLVFNDNPNVLIKCITKLI